MTGAANLPTLEEVFIVEGMELGKPFAAFLFPSEELEKRILENAHVFENTEEGVVRIVGHQKHPILKQDEQLLRDPNLKVLPVSL